MLPKKIPHIKAPPIKCQGIKTKLVDFITENIVWNGRGKWVEPFIGSGVVAFNIAPKRALLCDTNIHLINFYEDIQDHKINEVVVREYLVEKGSLLSEKGENFYYQERDAFNKNPDSLRFLFLNRCSFNGLVRFNAKGFYNVPFGKKPNRFRKAYITKIVNQVAWLRSLIDNSDWVFDTMDFRTTFENISTEDFVYLDPPYIGRHTDYFNSWDEAGAIELAQKAGQLPCGFALSMWLENTYRKNMHIQTHWNNTIIKKFSHYYHVGPVEKLRNPMVEALVIKKGYAAEGDKDIINPQFLSA